MTYVLRISDRSRVASTIQIERGGYTYETETSLAKAFFFKVHAKVEDCWRSRGDTNISESAQSYVYSLGSKRFLASSSRKLQGREPKKGMTGEGEGNEVNCFLFSPPPPPSTVFFVPALTFAQ